MAPPNSDLTWEDVFAVCKLMGVVYESTGFEDDSYMFLRPHYAGFGSTFTDPISALEFISAPEHPLEKKHANILRNQP